MKKILCICLLATIYMNLVGCSGNQIHVVSTPVSTDTSNDAVSIKLWEYGSQVVQNSYSHKVDYDITVKDTSGMKHSFHGYMSSNSGDRIYISEQSNLVSIFNTSDDDNNKIKFHIVNKDRPTTYYNFTVDISGFADEYTKLW